MTRELRTGEKILLGDIVQACGLEAVLGEVAPHITQALADLRSYDDALNTAEKAPTGDDYNALFRIMADILPTDGC
mgnify:CR=1 FL=1